MTESRPAAPTPPPLAGLDALADAAVLVSPEGVITYANPQAARLVRSTVEDLVGARARKRLRLRADDGADWWAHEPLSADPTVVHRMAEQELNLIVGEETRAIAMTGSWFRPAGGTAPSLLLTLRRADARRRRDAARSDLVSTVSHELRSPLTSVKGFTKTLLAKWDRFNDEQKRQMLATVNEDADRVTRLLGELLAVSRIDAGRLQLKRQMVRVDAITNQTVERVLAGVGEERDIIVEIGDLPTVYADPDRLAQILGNLLENAVKYTEGLIRVTASEQVDHVQIAIADSGEGIDGAVLQNIFTKFFRRPGEKKQGTGLGLYITKGLVEAHGGEVWATSSPGRGSTFIFTLPKGGLELAGIDIEALRSTTVRG